MIGFSSFILIVCSLFAALLPYRQPQKLPDQARPLASLSALSCLFITLSAAVSLFMPSHLGDTQAVVLIFDNLANYLALPLLSCLVVSACLKRYITKATWGRVSLVLLAIFEVCRRAEIGDIYSSFIAIMTSAAIGYCLLIWLKGSSKMLLVNIATLLCYALAAVVFSKTTGSEFQNPALYNGFLGFSLIGIAYNLANTISKIDSALENKEVEKDK